MTTVYSLYLGHDFYGQRGDFHVGTFSTQEDAIIEGENLKDDFPPFMTIFVVEHVLGKCKYRIDLLDPSKIHFVRS